MSIKNKYRVIGFAGCGQQELIAACALSFLRKEKKVLLMDFSKVAELRSMISLPEDLEEVKNVIVSYRGIDYIKAEKGTSIEDFAFEYDVILADFGRNLVSEEMDFCDEQYYITNMQRHNLRALKSCIHKENTYFVLKEFIFGKANLEFYAEELNIEVEQLIVLPYKEKEQLLFLLGTQLDRMNYRWFSQETKELIKGIVEDRKGRKQVWS